MKKYGIMGHTRLLLHTQREPIKRDQPDETNVVVVIDGENTSSKSIGFIQSHAERMGALLVQIVLGNWSSGCLHGWESLLTSHRLEPRHHGQVAAGKNATDIDLTVTVMHLYSCGIRKFCIVASDSDYTPLVEFLCAQGCLIMGIGNATTPSALQDACSVFIPLVTSHGSSCSQEGSTSKMMPIPLASEIILARMSQGELKVWLLEELSSYEPAPFTWVQVSQFWNHLVRSKSSFKPKAYGYKNIRGVLQASPEVFQLRPYKGRENVYEVRRVPL